MEEGNGLRIERERRRKRGRCVGDCISGSILSLLSLGWFFSADPLRADVEFSLLFFSLFSRNLKIKINK